MLSVLLAAMLTFAHAGDPDATKQPPTAPAPAAVPCERTKSQYVAGRNGAPGMKRLDQEPPAQQYLGVLHTVHGCEKMIEVGAFRRRARTNAR